MIEDSVTVRAIAAGRSSGPIHPWHCIRFAYGFVLRNLWQLVWVSILPLLLAATALYISLRAYLEQGLYYLQTGDTRAAGIGLFSFVAGLMAAVFFYGVAVAMNAAVGMKASSSVVAKPMRPQIYWRVFAASTRLLLCGLVLLIAMTALSNASSRILPVTVFVAVTILGLGWLFVRLGFLLPAIALGEQGPVLRRAWSLSARDIVALCISFVLLMVPGTVIELGGEYLLRGYGGGQLSSSLFDYVGAVGRMLVWFVAIMSAAAFVNIALLTAGSVYAYRILVPDARR